MKFKPDCSDRWQGLAKAVDGMDGSIVSQCVVDGVELFSVLFSGYGEVANVPAGELIQQSND